ncbi:WD repeat-containing protein 74 [Harmonia axyridis]|uniref:WD repeat-containing protein 74 n=1 Tax=Harmonia axyridis TaxID=115357 RepID=UPI001E27948F|nr:WD repeat-containing protein 74 [Harmonia axyridis]
MDLNDKYSIYVGSARGTITYTDLNPEKKNHYEFAAEASEINSMIWKNETEILVGYKNGIVSTYDTITQKYGKIFDQCRDEGSVVGLGSFGKKILVTSAKGKINIIGPKNKIYSIVTLYPENGTLETSSQSMDRLNIIATGGEMNDVKLWDVEAKECIFKAKSMGHDHLNLPIKTSVRGITFIPGEPSLCCCATKEGHVLIYDERAQRRPVCKFLEPKASFSSITTAYRERNILAGTTKGYIEYIDMKKGKCLRTFTGTCGSVTSLLCDPVEPILFATSLDRYLRIYNLDTKEILNKQYLKQNLKRILVKPIVKKEEEIVPNNKTTVDEFDEIFNNLEVISEETAKKQKAKAELNNKSQKDGDLNTDGNEEISNNPEAVAEKPKKTRKIKKNKDQSKKDGNSGTDKTEENSNNMEVVKDKSTKKRKINKENKVEMKKGGDPNTDRTENNVEVIEEIPTKKLKLENKVKSKKLKNKILV